MKVKLYIDELEVGELLRILIRLPLSIAGVIREEWFWWTKLNKYEIIGPSDPEKERAKALKEFHRRSKKYAARGKR